MTDETTKSCPECQGEMIAGARRDKMDLVVCAPESWVPAKPRKDLPIIQMRTGKPVPVVTWACTQCGRLVSYVNRY